MIENLLIQLKERKNPRNLQHTDVIVPAVDRELQVNQKKES